MFWYVVFGFLAAFGLLCAAFVAWGLFFNRKVKCRIAVICPKGQELAVIQRFCHLRQFGLTCSSLTILDTSVHSAQQQIIHARHPYVDFCTGQAWLDRQEKECIDHGDGDITGDHRCSCISEL